MMRDQQTSVNEHHLCFLCLCIFCCVGVANGNDLPRTRGASFPTKFCNSVFNAVRTSKVIDGIVPKALVVQEVLGRFTAKKPTLTKAESISADIASSITATHLHGKNKYNIDWS